tara:strand:- start:8006 stop:8908 length:903 start_codon:yes stop_codon:yes gene_type:complete
MKITNKHNAPDSLVAFANAKHYDAGGSTYTVTQLIDSPRVRILRSRHYRDMEEDVYATVFRLVGTSLHHIAEQYGGEGAEERLFLDLTEELGRGERLVVSGAIDLQSDDDGAVVIGDYKMTSVAATRFPDKWAKQLNMYAYLVQRVNGKRVSKLEVYAILKDWNWRTASTRSDYPKQPGVTIPIDLWSYEEQEDFFMGRIKAHIEADTMEEPPRCTKDEQWRGQDKWAVMSRSRDKRSKNPKGRALSLHGNELEAVAKVESDTTNDLYIESRPGEATRCVAFCDASRWCTQYKEENESNE